jgi:hypothetical protein
MLREGLDDWQQGIGGQKRGFVGFCVDDGRLGRHMRKLAIKDISCVRSKQTTPLIGLGKVGFPERL